MSTVGISEAGVASNLAEIFAAGVALNLVAVGAIGLSLRGAAPGLARAGVAVSTLLAAAALVDLSHRAGAVMALRAAAVQVVAAEGALVDLPHREAAAVARRAARVEEAVEEGKVAAAVTTGGTAGEIARLWLAKGGDCYAWSHLLHSDEDPGLPLGGTSSLEICSF
jgi:hypothetical protein